MSKIICILFSLFPLVSYAAPPVIWYGNDSKFLNSGSIIVPGLAPGGVCSVDTNGKFTVGSIASTSVTGTANKFAGFSSGGTLEGIGTFTRNTLGGLDVVQPVNLADTGISESKVFNSHSVTMSPTTPITNNYYYADLEQYDLNGTNNFLSFTGRESLLQQTGSNAITSEVVMWKPRIHYGVGGGVNSSQNTKVLDSSIRLSGNHTANNIIASQSTILMDSGTTASYAIGHDVSTYVGGTVTDATGINNAVQVDGSATNNIYGFNQGMTSTFLGSTVQNATQMNMSYTGDIVANYTGINASFNGDIGSNANGLNLNHQGTTTGSFGEINTYNNQTITGSWTGLNLTRDGPTTNYATGINLNMTNAATFGNSLTFIGAGNDATVAESATGINIYQNGNVAKAWTGASFNLSGNAGDGSSYISGVNVNFGLGDSISGSAAGFAFNNQSSIIGTNDLNGATLINSGAGYRFRGLTVYNSADQTEEFMGSQVTNDNADMVTATGYRAQLSGNFTGYVGGVSVNVGSAVSSSTTNHVKSFDGEGGIFNQYGSFSPFNSYGVDIGNTMGVTSTIQSGSPLTGTDQIITLLQSNLIAQDAIATGPFGLDTTMLGAVSQVEVGSGITIPLVRAQLTGTTVPSGSGGTIDTYVGLEVLGLPSFGGSVTVNNKYGVKDSQLVGQDFCGGVTDCWFLNVRDDAAENYLERLAIYTTSEKVRTNVRLDVNDGHIGTDQTTSPVATVDANAGTGGACVISKATDTAFHLEVTTETGAAAGAQCSVAFNQSYVAAPVCTFSPTDANSGANAVQSYQTRTTTNWVINFVVAGGTSVTYGYDVICLESK